MSDTKQLIGSIAAFGAVVAAIAIMADCSKHVADVEASPQKACLQAGGHWSNLNDPLQGVGHCEKRAAQ